MYLLPPLYNFFMFLLWPPHVLIHYELLLLLYVGMAHIPVWQVWQIVINIISMQDTNEREGKKFLQ